MAELDLRSGQAACSSTSSDLVRGGVGVDVLSATGGGYCVGFGVGENQLYHIRLFQTKH